MRDFNLRELQLSELTILEEVDRLCKENNLTYYLAWGSALGAKRHQGFIPWDDDIDVCMPWEDYWKFKEICQKQLDTKYYYQDFISDSDYYLYWAKIRKNNTTSLTVAEKDLKMHWGICIDVFPLIPLKKDRLSSRCKFYHNLLVFLCNKPFIFCKGYPATLIKKIKKCIYYCISEKNRVKLAKKCLLALGKEDANYYVDISEGTNSKIFPKDVFGKGKDIQFENKKYVGPMQIERYLESVYGNGYMQIPEEHERVDHGNIIVDLHKDYSFYQNND